MREDVARGPDARHPLRGRIVLVVGAEDPATRRTALHVAARGAALILAGRDLSEVLVTAGLGAASGATTRVLEAPCPPLVGADLFAAAKRVLARPTDALVAEAVVRVYPNFAADIRRLLGKHAFSCVVPVRPAGGTRAFAEATCTEFEAVVASGGSDSGPAADTLGSS